MKTDLKELAIGCAMLTHLTRLGILQALARGPMNVKQLGKILKLKQPIVSMHLGLLRLNRLVIGDRNGKEVLGARVQAAGAQGRIRLVGRHQDDGKRRRRPSLGFQAAAQFDAADRGHANVDQRHVDRRGAGRTQSLLGVGRGNDLTAGKVG